MHIHDDWYLLRPDHDADVIYVHNLCGPKLPTPYLIFKQFPFGHGAINLILVDAETWDQNCGYAHPSWIGCDRRSRLSPQIVLDISYCNYASSNKFYVIIKAQCARISYGIIPYWYCCLFVDDYKEGFVTFLIMAATGSHNLNWDNSIPTYFSYSISYHFFNIGISQPHSSSIKNIVF